MKNTGVKSQTAGDTTDSQTDNKVKQTAVVKTSASSVPKTNAAATSAAKTPAPQLKTTRTVVTTSSSASTTAATETGDKTAANAVKDEGKAKKPSGEENLMKAKAVPKVK